MTLITKDELFVLLQNDYFDNIDTKNAKGAAQAMHKNVEWIHTQVWAVSYTHLTLPTT